MSTARVMAVLFLGAASLGGGCSEENDPPRGDPADCRLISNRCHKYDTGSGLAHECHETGHDSESPAACTEMKARCLAGCPETDGGVGGSGGSGTGGGAGTGGTAGSGAVGGSDGGGATGGNAGESSGGSAGDAGGGSGGSSPDGSVSACDLLGDVCHGIDGGFTEHCHELGHDGDETLCEAELSACLAACTDAGT